MSCVVFRYADLSQRHSNMISDAVLDMLHSCRSQLEEDQLYPSVPDAISAIRFINASQDDQSGHQISR